MTRPLLLTLATVVMAQGLARQPAAVVNRLLADRGRDTFATPADIAEALFGGSTKVVVALQSLAALTILGAVSATLVGVFQTLRGERGGVGLMLGGAYGLVGVMAALTVVL